MIACFFVMELTHFLESVVDQYVLGNVFEYVFAVNIQRRGSSSVRCTLHVRRLERIVTISISCEWYNHAHVPLCISPGDQEFVLKHMEHKPCRDHNCSAFIPLVKSTVMLCFLGSL